MTNPTRTPDTKSFFAVVRMLTANLPAPRSAILVDVDPADPFSLGAPRTESKLVLVELN